jgi:hypothetical protein
MAKTHVHQWQWGQQPHCDDGKDTGALMMTKMPLQQGWQHQLEDGNNTIAKRGRTLSRIKGKNTIVTRETIPAQWQQGRLRINSGNNAIIMRATIAIATTAKTPVHQWWRQHQDEGGNASSMMSNEVNNASLTMVEMPAQWQ